MSAEKFEPILVGYLPPALYFPAGGKDRCSFLEENMQEQAAVLHNKDPSFLQVIGHLNLVLQVTKRWYKVYVQGLT